MIRHNVDFFKNEPRFMPLNIFHLNSILMLMIKINIKEFLFHKWKIRAEGYSSLNILLSYSPSCHGIINFSFLVVTGLFAHYLIYSFCLLPRSIVGVNDFERSKNAFSPITMVIWPTGIYRTMYALSNTGTPVPGSLIYIFGGA